VAIFVVWVGCPGALACYGPTLERTIFFDPADLTHGIDGPVIAEVTITDTATVAGTNGPGYWTAVARVEKVLKGHIDGRAIKMKVMWIPSIICDPTFRVGVRGIVVGTLERDSRGAIGLVAKVESLEERGNRWSPSGNK
jgi:hypothetical protein